MALPPKDGSKRLLIVDDSKFVRTTFNRIVSASFDVREEADGEAAWLALQGDPSIGMVFTDLDMPKLDGFGLIARIRQSDDPHIAKLPVIVISGHEDQAAKMRARGAGANDFISKTTDAPEVLSRIENLLRQVRQAAAPQPAPAPAAAPQPAPQPAAHPADNTNALVSGAVSIEYLLAEGAKRFAQAQAQGSQLSVLVMRVDSYAQVAKVASKDVADQILVRIAKLIASMSRTEDVIGRTPDATFVLVSEGTGAPQVLAFAKRLQEQLANAKVRYAEQLLKIDTSYGVSSLGVDAVNSIAELVKLAMQRLQKSAADRRAAEKSGSLLPAEIERVVQYLEQLEPEKLGDSTDSLMSRLLGVIKKLERRKSLLTL